jgi:hypothetical protein
VALCSFEGKPGISVGRVIGVTLETKVVQVEWRSSNCHPGTHKKCLGGKWAAIWVVEPIEVKSLIVKFCGLTRKGMKLPKAVIEAVKRHPVFKSME